MKMQYKIIMLLTSLCLMSCEKFLDEKPNKKLVIPTNVADVQALLDNKTLLNEKEPNTTVVAADEFYLSTTTWNSLSEINRNLYTWAATGVFQVGSSNNWVSMYGQIYNANVALAALNELEINTQNSAQGRNVRGQALFLRAKCYFHLINIWALQYDKLKAKTDLAVPLRLNINFNEPSKRATVAQCHQQIINDLREAAEIIDNEPLHVIRPAKAATFALLARVYLGMNNVDSTLYFTEQALKIKNNLMNFNNDNAINPNATYPFQRFNPEVIFDSFMPTNASVANGSIDPALYNSYHANDLRKNLFHRSNTTVGNFKGTYSNGSHWFNGITTAELYLMKAECLARLSLKNESMGILNYLLSHRFKTNSFVPFVATDANQALEMVLMERRKELVFRGLRWFDIKRLNKIDANIVLKRNLDKEYVLLPNDLKFAMPIPEDIIAMTNLIQNFR